MLSVIYQSEASFDFSEEDLSVLLMNSRANNRRQSLTGLLLYREGHFVQVLEGPESAVRTKLEVICADPRHRQVRFLSEQRDVDRRYPEWTMGFKTVIGSFNDYLPGFHALSAS